MCTVATDSLKGGQSHDKIVDEFDGNIQESSVEVVVPLRVDDKVFFRGLHVVGVENDLAEVHVGDEDVLIEGDVPLVVGVVEDLGVDVKLDRIARPPPDPQTSYKQHDVVAGVRSCEMGELLSMCLLRVIYGV